MKPFDLESAKRGEPIVCRDGTPAEFVADVPKWESILVVLDDEDHCVDYASSGLSKHSHKKDLFMAQKREWVGLTDHDIHQLRQQGAHSVSDKEFRMIEAKLKEKNG